jgi:hypothetical protein
MRRPYLRRGSKFARLLPRFGRSGWVQPRSRAPEAAFRADSGRDVHVIRGVPVGAGRGGVKTVRPIIVPVPRGTPDTQETD